MLSLSHFKLSPLPNAQDVDDGESDDASDDGFASAPLFSCRWRGKHDLFTHASAHHLLYNLGGTAFVRENRSSLSLDTRSAAHWLSFTDSKEVKKVLAKLTIKIPGGRIAKG